MENNILVKLINKNDKSNYEAEEELGVRIRPMV